MLGALHGLEPGHSKTMMAAFIIAVRGTMLQAVLLGLSAAFSHSLIIWVLAAAALRYGSHWNAEATEPYFHLFSAAVIVVLAAWMFWRTRRDVRAAHDHHHHHGGHDDATLFETALGTVKLLVFEDGVPPVFRVELPADVSGSVNPADVCIETLRVGGARETYSFAAREGFLESTTEIPEPHEFDLTLTVAHEGQSHLYLAQFREHDHDHGHPHPHGQGADFEDAHEAAHALDIQKRFLNRQVTTPQIIAFGLTGGLMPCPAAFTVLLVCLQVKQFTLGFALVGAFSFGLALTMVSVGAMAAWSVQHAEKKFRGFGELMRKAPYFSCVVLVVLAGYLAWQGWHGPHRASLRICGRNRLARSIMLCFMRRAFLNILLPAAAFLALAQAAFAASKPNIIFILCDNAGNGDLACNGSKLHRTPNLDRLAAEGLRLTSFYSASGVCSPARAALMTGCYPRRINMHVSGDGGAVLRPVDSRGLNPAEVTIARMLKKEGYATSCIGKWHLGDQPEFLPTRQGFDEYLGIPYSEDMTKDKFPDIWPELPLMRGEKVIEAPVDRNLLTKRYTEAAVDFIARHKDRPFFLYLAHAMPGSTPQPFASAAFKGKSANGVYGDSIEELDWSAGAILQALKDNKLEENTLVVWTSDNGAVRRNPPQGGNAPYKGWGYATEEGGMRMPCILRWPAHVPAGAVCDELCTMMDFLPTFAKLVGAPLPAKAIDGHDAAPLWFTDKPGRSAYDDSGFFYYDMAQLQAVRAGDWKLYLPLDKKTALGNAKPKVVPLALYDVRHDVAEQHEVSAEHGDVVARLTAFAENARRTLGDQDRPGSEQRAAGRVEHPVPQLLKAE